MKIRLSRPPSNSKCLDGWYTRKAFNDVVFDVTPDFRAGNKYFRLQGTPENMATLTIMQEHLTNRAKMFVNSGMITQMFIDGDWCQFESDMTNKEIAFMVLKKDEVILSVSA